MADHTVDSGLVNFSTTKVVVFCVFSCLAVIIACIRCSWLRRCRERSSDQVTDRPFEVTVEAGLLERTTAARGCSLDDRPYVINVPFQRPVQHCHRFTSSSNYANETVRSFGINGARIQKGRLWPKYKIFSERKSRSATNKSSASAQVRIESLSNCTQLVTKRRNHVAAGKPQTSQQTNSDAIALVKHHYQAKLSSQPLPGKLPGALIIVTDATPLLLGGYCIQPDDAKCSFYSISTTSLPRCLRVKNRTNSAEFEMRNLSFALFYWEDLILNHGAVYVYTDNNAIKAKGKNPQYGELIRSYLSHLERCCGVKIKNRRRHHIFRNYRGNDHYDRYMAAADHLSRNRIQDFYRKIRTFFPQVTDFQQLHRGKILANKVQERWNEYRTNPCACDFMGHKVIASRRRH